VANIDNQIVKVITSKQTKEQDSQNVISLAFLSQRGNTFIHGLLSFLRLLSSFTCDLGFQTEVKVKSAKSSTTQPFNETG
jgi:hypothetical protein